MDILEALGLGEREVVAFTGGGGKTTFMNILSGVIKSRGKKSLMTTTTHMLSQGSTIIDNDEDRLYDILCSIPDNIFPVLAGSEISREGKLCGVTTAFVGRLWDCRRFPYILVEADGSKGKSVKALDRKSVV